MLRVILKKMKPARTHGTDWIDSFSLKVASPLLEDCLLNLVNLSIVELICRKLEATAYTHHAQEKSKRCYQ